MRISLRVCFLLSVILLSTTCSPKLNKIWIGSDTEIAKLEDPETYQSPCNDPVNYAPDEFSDSRKVRINIHIINNPEETANFKFAEGKKFLKNLFYNANEKLGLNTKMNLPVGNDTPVLDPHFRYSLVATEGSEEGFYYHLDEHDYYFLNKGRKKNNYKKAVVKRYAVMEDSVVNVFLISHPQDSLGSKTYKATRTGIALGNSLKISGIFSKKEKPPWYFGALWNHEVGHVLGLAHAWNKYDGCDDTPVHPNCWDEDSGPPCDGTYSNNVMDYNKSQTAYTPCQIGKIHKGFSQLNSRIRGVVVPQWCTADTTKDIVIEKETHWQGARDLRRNIIVREGASLHLHCRVSMAKGTKVTVEPNAELHLHSYSQIHNSCGDLWDGVEVVTKKDASKQLFFYGDGRLEDVVSSSIK